MKKEVFYEKESGRKVTIEWENDPEKDDTDKFIRWLKVKQEEVK